MPDELCAMHHQIEAALIKIDGKLDAILARINSGDTQFAVLSVRLLEAEAKIGALIRGVVGLAGVVGVAILGAVLKLILVP